MQRQFCESRGLKFTTFRNWLYRLRGKVYGKGFSGTQGGAGRFVQVVPSSPNPGVFCKLQVGRAELWLQLGHASFAGGKLCFVRVGRGGGRRGGQPRRDRCLGRTAADQLWTNSSLRSSEYSSEVLFSEDLDGRMALEVSEGRSEAYVSLGSTLRVLWRLT
jgi:hypothetical protein